MIKNEKYGGEGYRTAVYIRLSREDGDKEESDSVGNQRKLLLNYLAEHEELKLYEIYVDDGFSGTSFDRPAFRRMMEDLEKKRADCVLVKDLSRFGRDYIDTGRYLERIFPELHVRFIALTDGIDSLRGSYDMLLPIKNIFNEQYARDISKKIQSAVRAKQKNGEFIGAFACFGYRKSAGNHNHLVPDPCAAEVVRRIFSLYADGVSRGEIAELLNKEGIPSPTEYKRQNGENYIGRNSSYYNGWTYSSVYQILENEMYLGNMVQGKKHQQMRGRQQAKEKESWIRVCGTHEAIIDEETWRRTRGRTNRIQRGRDKNTGGVPGGTDGFGGLLRCGECGGTMVKNCWYLSDGKLKEVFYCGTYRRKGKSACTPHSVPAEILEKALREDLRTFSRYIGQHLKDFCVQWDRETLPEERQERQRIQKMADKAEHMCRTLYEDYQEGILTKKEFLEYREFYRKKQEVYAAQLKWVSGDHAAQEKRDQAAAGGTSAERQKEAGPEQMLADMDAGRFPKRMDNRFLREVISQIIVFESGIIEIKYFSEAFSPLKSGDSGYNQTTGQKIQY